MPDCPICKSPTEPRWRPFCSKRCADIDLGRWMTGGYAIPSDAPLEEEDAAALAARAEGGGENAD